MRIRAVCATAVLGIAAGVMSASGPAVGIEDAVAFPSTVVPAGEFELLDGWIYYPGFTSEYAEELWRTDGESVELVADIEPGPSSSSPHDLVRFGDWVYFTADTEATGSELWRTNGSTTELVADLTPGSDSSRPGDKTVFDGELYFTTFDALWRIDDGSVAVVPGSEGIPLGRLVELDGWLFIAGSGGIHRTDGSVVDLVSSIDVRGDRELFAGGTPPAAMDGWLYFAGRTGSTGNELWRTNGVATQLVADIWPGGADSEPFGITPLDGWVYFGATSPGTGAELWRSDGATTELVADISPGDGSEEGMGSSYPGSFVSYDGWVYFTAAAQFAETIWWRTDGTTTERFADLAPSPYVNDVAETQVFGDLLHFTGAGRLWRTDGEIIEPVATVGSVVFADYLAPSTRWTSTTWTASTGGRHEFLIESFGAQAVSIEVRDASTGRWIGANTTDVDPKVLAVDLVAGVEYRVAVWPASSFLVRVVEPGAPPPTGEVVFGGTIDAAAATGPRWVSSTLTPATTGTQTLRLAWEGPADARFEVRDAVNGAWLAAAVDGPAPRSVTLELMAGHPYRLAVWAASGSADVEITLGAGEPPPMAEVVFGGTVDATRSTAPKWMSTTYTAMVSGLHVFSFGDSADPNLRMELRNGLTGAWLAAGRSSMDVDLVAGRDHRLAVWVVDGTADFEVTLDRPDV